MTPAPPDLLLVLDALLAVVIPLTVLAVTVCGVGWGLEAWDRFQERKRHGVS